MRLSPSAPSALASRLSFPALSASASRPSFPAPSDEIPSPTGTLLPASFTYSRSRTFSYCLKSAPSMQADAAVPAERTARVYSAFAFPKEMPKTIVSVTMHKKTAPARIRFLPLLLFPISPASIPSTVRLSLGVNPFLSISTPSRKSCRPQAAPHGLPSAPLPPDESPLSPSDETSPRRI